MAQVHLVFLTAYVSLIAQATFKLSVFKWNTTEKSFRILYKSWQLSEKPLRRELLAFPWTCPKVQAKCTVVKVATSISKKETAYSPAKHVILPVRTFFLLNRNTHSSLQHLKWTVSNCNENYSCPEERLSPGVQQGSSWGSARLCPRRGQPEILCTDTRGDLTTTWAQGLGITSASGGAHRSYLGDFPLRHTVV